VAGIVGDNGKTAADAGATGGGAQDSIETTAETKAGLTFDVQAINKLVNALTPLINSTTAFKKELEAAAKASQEIKVPGDGGKSDNGQDEFKNSSPKNSYANKGEKKADNIFEATREHYLGKRDRGPDEYKGEWGELSPRMKGVAVGVGAMATGKYAANTVDNRTLSNRQYSLEADRLSVAFQLRQGISDDDYRQMREPLGDYKVSTNAMLGYELETGIKATPDMASGIEGIRAMSGWSMSTEDELGIYQQNLDPERANMQFMMMGGMTAYGPGGEPVDQEQMMRQRMKMFGLDDEILSRGARRQGSNVRQRMTASGISAEEQDLLIEMGETQRTFEAAGGSGDFDLSDRDDRKLLDIEDNQSTQAEETERVRVKREEDMFRRQTDNYATLEESNQNLIQALNGLEDVFSPLVGLRTSTAPIQDAIMNMIPGLGLATGALSLAGIKIPGIGDPPDKDGNHNHMPSSGGPPAAVSSAQSAAKDAEIMVPVGWSKDRQSLKQIKERSDFSQMKPQFKDRLLAMMRTNPNVGWNGGYRDTEMQRKEFLRRHRETTKGNHDRTWNGKYWKLVTGAPYAPPGSSYHEIGMAADLAGDLDWMNANSHRFGLKHFKNVGNEPWHVQPSEFPNSRAKYEEMGAPWGTNTNEDGVGGEFGGEVDEGGLESEDSPSESHYGGGGGGSMGGEVFQGMSIQQIVDTYTHGGGGVISGGWGGSNGGHGQTNQGSTDTGTTMDAVDFNGTVGGGAMMAAEAAYKVGFRGQDLADITAIAGRESGWIPSAINRDSNDTGMWQIAPMNFNGFTQSELLNVDNNAKVMKLLFGDSENSERWKPWRAASSRKKNSKGVWVVDPSGQGKAGWASDGDHMWNTSSHVGEATAAATAVTSANTGDPMVDAAPMAVGKRVRPPAPMTSSGSGNLGINNSYQIEFSPVVNITGTDQTNMQQMADQVQTLLKQSMDRALERSS